MKHLKIEDYENNLTYNFEHDDWFSEQNSRDGQTTRVLYKKPEKTSESIDLSESFSSSGSSVSISGSSTPSRSSARGLKDQPSRVSSGKKSSKRSSQHSTRKADDVSSRSSRSRSRSSSRSNSRSGSESRSRSASKRSGSIKSKHSEKVPSPARSDSSPVIFKNSKDSMSPLKDAEKRSTTSAKSGSKKRASLESDSSSSLSSTSSSTSLSSTSSSSSYKTRSSYSGSTRRKSKSVHDEEEEEEDAKSQIQTDSINQNKDVQMSTKSLTSKHSTSSSVREAEEEITEITSRKFTISPSPPSTPTKQSQSEFSVRAVSSTKLKMTIFDAVKANELDTLKDLIQKSPVDIRKIDSSGNTLMIIACEKGYEQIVKYLADNNDELLRIDTPLGE